MNNDPNKYFCPRLLDYLVIAGCRYPSGNNQMSQTPELLRRYPLEDHKDFPLPNDVIFFCQPEGCISIGPRRMSLRETTSFVFTLTEKDSGLVRYGICINFYRPFEKRAPHASSTETWQKVDKSTTGSSHSVETVSSSEGDRPSSPGRSRKKTRIRNNTLTSLCIVSHHPFFSTFRECLFILRRLIEACHDRSCVRRVGGSKATVRDTLWGVLTGQTCDNISPLVMHEVKEIETWILRLLSAPVPVPGKTRVEVYVLPKELQPPLMFALPDNTRFSLVDFPLHLPLELLGVDTCLKALTAIMLEHKVILQSRDYNALSMSVMAFVSMLYPLEYMFPVIPLLPTCMASAEQLLLAPTPYLIGVPASFFGYKKGFPLPDDIWVVDLDGNKIIAPAGAEPLPPLPEPEGTSLKTHLKQALASMSMTPQPIKNLDALAQNPELLQRRDSLTQGFNPLIYGNDVDSVDVATRVAMVRFLNSPNTLGNFTEHTRTLRLYPRPVVAFQLYSFLKSRKDRTAFTRNLARTQAVEYLSEWSLCPTNLVYQRVQTSVFDPSLIGDKPKWYAQQLQMVDFHAYDSDSSLGAAIASVVSAAQEKGGASGGGLGGHSSDDGPTDESGSDSDGAESTSSSYSSLSDFVSDLYNSEIRGETPSFQREMQKPAVDVSAVYSPPSQLHLPGDRANNSDSALSLQEDSDMSSSGSSSPTYSQGGGAGTVGDPGDAQETVFRYDSGNLIDTSQRSDANKVQHSPGISSRIPGSPNSPRLVRTSSSGSSPRPTMPPASPSARMTPPLNRKPGLQTGLRPPSGPIKPSKSGSSSPSSLISALSNEFTDFAHTATSTVSELFGTNKQGQNNSSVPPKPAVSKPFTHLGNRKALVERSGLVRHSTTVKPPPQKESSKASGDSRASSNRVEINISRYFESKLIHRKGRENQQFLKDVISSVLEGKGVGWRKVKRLKELMCDENYRNFVVSRINRNMDRKVSEDASHIDDVLVNESVLSGILQVVKAILHGLDHTIKNHGLGGMASAYMVLEIAHTHYWQKESSGGFTPERRSLHGSQDSLNSPIRKMSDEISTSKWWSMKRGSNPAVYTTNPSSHPFVQQQPYSASSTIVTSTTNKQSANLNTTDPFMSSPSTESDDGGIGRPGGSSSGGEQQLASPDNPCYSDSGGEMAETGPYQHHHDQHRLRHSVTQPPDRNGNPARPDPLAGGDVTGGFMSSADWNKNASMRQQQQQRQQPASGGGSNGGQPPMCDIVVTNAELQGQGDMLREMVKNKELMKTSKLDRKFSSVDSEMSEASTLVSTSSEKEEYERRRHRINHQSIRSLRSEGEPDSNWPGGSESPNPPRSISPSVLSTKSAYTSGYRYHDGRLEHTGTLGLLSVTSDPRAGSIGSSAQNRKYLFEELVGNNRSQVWEHMQFWEDMFLDAVAQERDIIGMDQRPSEMMERYNSLGDLEKKRLEHDEDRLLSVMLFNLTAFMLMMRVPKAEIKKKVRRLLGKSHIGLNHSQDINSLLDSIQHLHGNDIDLKLMCSRRTQKLKSYTVHKGSESGDMLFMEVCEDCLLLRNVTGAIHDRWWYEKLVNMTYCPKTRLLCLWRKNNDKVQLNQFYTKKCRELYFSVKGAMEKAASRNTGIVPGGTELGGEFPVQDLRTKEGGLLQVCMEGIGLLLQNSKLFIDLKCIRKCSTQKGGIFVLEEFDHKTKQIIQHKFLSSQANKIVGAFQRIISVQTALLELKTKDDS